MLVAKDFLKDQGTIVHEGIPCTKQNRSPTKKETKRTVSADGDWSLTTSGVSEFTGLPLEVFST